MLDKVIFYMFAIIAVASAVLTDAISHVARRVTNVVAVATVAHNGRAATLAKLRVPIGHKSVV